MSERGQRMEFQDHLQLFCERHNNKIDNHQFIDPQKCVEYIVNLQTRGKDGEFDKLVNQMYKEEDEAARTKPHKGTSR